MVISSPLAVVVVITVAILHGANARNFYDDDQDLMPHDRVAIQSSFLTVPNATTFPLGEPVVVLFAVRNNAETSLLMEGVKAHLHSPFKYHNHIQNFTMKALIGDIAPAQTKTFVYRFRPHPNLLPISYRLAIDVTYSVNGDAYLSTFFNNTISLYEKPWEMETGFVIQASIAFAGTVIGVIALMAIFKGQGKSRSSGTKPKYN